MTTIALDRIGRGAVARVAMQVMRDVGRGRLIAGYAAFYALATGGLLWFTGSSAATLVSLMSIVLFLTPLVTVVFAAIYVFDAREFIELLAVQPLRRPVIHAGLYLGVAVPLALSFVVGTALPFAIHGNDGLAPSGGLAVLLGVGVALTLVFVAIALAVAVRLDDKVKGLGVAIVLWLAFAVLYDGLVLTLLTVFRDRATERPAIVMMLLNPIDLGRVLILLRFDIAALMGYTGASMLRFFGGGGALLAIGALTCWLAVPFFLSQRWFSRKDF